MKALARNSVDDIAARLSCADSAFPRLSHQMALDVVRDLRIPAVDICVFAGHEHTPPAAVVENPEGAAEAVLSRIERTGLAVADVFAILSDPYDELAVNHPDEAVRAESLRQFERIVRFARRIEAPGLTLLPGVIFDGTDPEESLDLAAAQLEHRAEISSEAGMSLSFEPHYQSVVENPARTLRLLEKAPDVTVTLDYGHFIFQGISQEEVDVLIPRTRHIQLRQAARGDMQTPAREGEIDFGVVLERLADAGYTGYLGLEYQWDKWMEFNHVDCISETAELRDVLLGK